MADILTATFKIITPLFLGDANHDCTRMRAESLKNGVLFWWRAAVFPKFVAAQNGDIAEALKSLHSRELLLFGGAEQQGSFFVSILKQQDHLDTYNNQQLMDNEDRLIGSGACYLGYGLMGAFGQNQGRLEQSCFQHSQFFKARFIFNQNLRDQDKDEILDAIKLFGLLGSLGARSRRGWGSLALLSLEKQNFGNENSVSVWDWPDNVETYQQCIQNLARNNPDTPLPNGDNFPITSFSSASRILTTTLLQTDPLHVLDDMGKGMQRYRSWGHDKGDGVHKVNGQVSEQNFKTDHNEFVEGRNRNRDFTPERAAFGLPHNYYSHKRRLAMNVSGAGDIDRRASPLFFHIHQTNDGQYFGVVTLLPTQFLPQHEHLDNKHQISIDGRNVPYKFDLTVLTNFLEGKPDPLQSWCLHRNGACHMSKQNTRRVLHFTLGPVQGFVAQARRTRDLWAGSFLLSWLSGIAMKTIVDGNTNNTIIFPKTDNDPLFLALQGQDHTPRIGSLPKQVSGGN